MLGLKHHADLLQQRRGQFSPGAHDHRVVADVDRLVFQLERHQIGLDFGRARLEHYPQAPCLFGRLERRAVLFLDATERLATVRQRDLRALLFGDRDGRFQGAVAAANHQHALALILLRIDQTVYDFRGFLAGDVQLARRSPPADRQQHNAGRVRAPLRLDGESALDPLDLFHPLAEVDLQAGFLDHRIPELEQLFLSDFGHLDFADDRQLHRRRHRYLVARVVEYRAAQGLLLLDQLVLEFVLDRAEAGRDARRTGPDDHHIVFQGAGLDRGADRVKRLAPLLGAFADQAHAAQFARDVDAGHVGFEIGVDLRDIDTALFGAEHELDRVDRARRQARSVADAVGGIDQFGLVVDDAQRVLGAGFHARRRSDAPGRIDDRVQGWRLHQSLLDGRLQRFLMLPVALAEAAQVQHDRPNGRYGVDQPAEQGLHSDSACSTAPKRGPLGCPGVPRARPPADRLRADFGTRKTQYARTGRLKALKSLKRAAGDRAPAKSPYAG